MRPIDADALFDEYEDTLWYDDADRDEIAEVLLLNAPTLDLEPVRHGRWVFVDSNGWTSAVECSICGWGSACVHPETWLKYQGHNFCGNCGARMDLEVNEP